MDLDGLLVRISNLGASDLHLKLGQPPVIRLDGLIEPVVGDAPLTEEALEQVIATITRHMMARSGASNCARASSRSSADRVAAALAAMPVAW